jgi:anti-sigma factor RsiW
MTKPQAASPYCAKMQSQFDDYRDGELSPFLKGVVSKHLKSCAECKREFRLFERTLQLVRAKESPEVPARLLKKVIRELQNGGSGGTPAKAPADPKLGLQGS